MKLNTVLNMLLPLLDIAASLLERRDSNTTGNDDRAAKIIRSAAAALGEFQRDPNG